jgi:hypothetical protein
MRHTDRDGAILPGLQPGGGCQIGTTVAALSLGRQPQAVRTGHHDPDTAVVESSLHCES